MILRPFPFPQTMFQAPNRREAIFTLLGTLLGAAGVTAFYTCTWSGGRGRDAKGVGGDAV